MINFYKFFASGIPTTSLELVARDGVEPQRHIDNTQVIDLTLREIR